MRLQVDQHLGNAQQVAVRGTSRRFLVLRVEFRGNVQVVGREGVEPAVDEVAQELAEPVEEGGELDTAIDGLVDHLEAALEVVALDGLNEFEEQFGGRDAEHGAYGIGVHLAAGKGVCLVKVGEAVAHGTVRLFGENLERLVGGVDVFLLADVAQARGNLADGQALEVETLHSGKDGRQELVHFGGREDENHVRRRFLEGLQERVECALGEHVDFVDNENLVLADDRRVLDAVNHVADVVDAGIGGRVDFVDIHRVSSRDIEATLAFSAGVQRVAAGAVECAGEDSGTGGLAYATGPGKQECVVESAPFDCVLEGLCDMFLPDHVVKGLRAPLAGHCYVCHDCEYRKKVRNVNFFSIINK